MKVIGKLPPREIEGADVVLDGMVGEVESGNRCAVWPAMTRVEGADQARIAFFIEWKRDTTPDDLSEAMAFVNKVMGGDQPLFLTEGKGDPTRIAENTEWLRNGKVPPPRRPDA